MKKIIKIIWKYLRKPIANLDLLVIVMLIVALAVIYGLFYEKNKGDSLGQTIVTDTVGVEDVSVEEMQMRAMIDKIYWDVHVEAIGETGDDEFMSFVLEKIDPICPFYEPDGITYRDCLYNLVDGIRKNFNGSANELKDAEDYCESISLKYYPSLEMAELYQCCIAYKLSKK